MLDNNFNRKKPAFRCEHDTTEASVSFTMHSAKGNALDGHSTTLVMPRRTFNVIDDFNREVLGIDIATSMPSLRVTRYLDQLAEWHGYPKKNQSR